MWGAAFALMAATALALGAEIKEDGGVLVINEKNFDEAITTRQNVLLLFYASWCGKCKTLFPEYQKAAAQLRQDGDDVRLAWVDGTAETKLTNKFRVQGYPTLKFFRKGRLQSYEGDLDAASIVAWLKRKTGPVAKAIASADDAEAFKDSADVVVLGFFKDASSREARVFLQVAGGMEDLSDAPFGLVSDPAVASGLGMAGDSAVVLFQNFDEGRADFDGEYLERELRSWVKVNSLPLVSEFSDESAPRLFGGEIKSHHLLFVSKQSPDFQTILAEFKNAAKEFRGKIQFIYVDTDAEGNQKIIEYFGLVKEEFPTVRLVYLEGDKDKYKPDFSDLTQATLRKFTQDYLDRKLKPQVSE